MRDPRPRAPPWRLRGPPTAARSRSIASHDRNGTRHPSCTLLPMENAVDFARDELVPRLRGLLHAWAFWFALVAAVVLIAIAPAGKATTAAGIYGVGLRAPFGAGVAYRRWGGNPGWKRT